MFCIYPLASTSSAILTFDRNSVLNFRNFPRKTTSLFTVHRTCQHVFLIGHPFGSFSLKACRYSCQRNLSIESSMNYRNCQIVCRISALLIYCKSEIIQSFQASCLVVWTARCDETTRPCPSTWLPNISTWMTIT